MNASSTVDVTLTHEEYHTIRSSLLQAEVTERMAAREMAARGHHEMARTAVEFADRIRTVIQLFPTKR